MPESELCEISLETYDIDYKEVHRKKSRISQANIGEENDHKMTLNRIGSERSQVVQHGHISERLRDCTRNVVVVEAPAAHRVGYLESK